jgi:hypothetical protein
MNTIDQAPKNGDFVAYIEELERRQLRANRAAAQTPSEVRTAQEAAQRRPAAISAENPPSVPVATTATAVKTAPLGLAVIGLALIIAGLMLQGGIFLIAMGIFLLWQAARPIIRALRSADAQTRSPAAQEVAALLAAHAERKRLPRK